jgi:hypothetical protein
MKTKNAKPLLRGRSFGYWSLCLLFAVLAASIYVVLAVGEDPLHLDDGLRHMAFASQIWVKGIHGWGDYFFAGYFSSRDFDPWFLAHLSYLPFTLLGPVEGLRWLTVTYALVLCAAFCLLLLRLRLSLYQISFLLVALVWGSTLFNWRLLSGRPLILASALLLLVVWAVLARRPLWIGVFLTVCFLFSHLFVFTWLVAMLGSAWLFLRGERSMSGRVLLAAVIAPVLGVVVHPQPVLYLTYLHEVFLVIPWLRAMGLGTEFTPGMLIPDPSVLVVIGLIVWFYWDIGKGTSWVSLVKSQAFFVGLLALVFGICWLFWVRAIDFFWPLLLAAAASAWQLRVNLKLGSGPKLMRSLLPVACLFFAVHWVTRILVSTEPPPSGNLVGYRLDVPAGSRILNLDWEVFAPMFFHRTDVKYARGMDPTFDHIDDFKRASLLDQVFSSRQQPPWAVGAGLLAGDKSVLYPAENTSIDRELWLKVILDEYRPNFLVLKRGRHERLEQALEVTPLLESLKGTDVLRVFRVRVSQGTESSDIPSPSYPTGR